MLLAFSGSGYLQDTSVLCLCYYISVPSTSENSSACINRVGKDLSFCRHVAINDVKWSHWNNNEKLKKNLETIPGKHSIDSLQNTAILGTSHIIRNVLQCEA